MGIVSSAKYATRLLPVRLRRFQSPMGIVSSAKIVAGVVPNAKQSVSIPDGDSFLREESSTLRSSIWLAVSIPDGDSFLREVGRSAGDVWGVKFQSPMGIVSSAKAVNNEHGITQYGGFNPRWG